MSNKPIIVFEGIEGSGKSHHIRKVSNFLKKKRIKFRYTGIDINETFINKCKAKYKNVNFINSHFLKYKIKTKPDYIIISGALNLPMDNYSILLKKIISKMHKNSKEKSIFNLLSSSSKKIYQFNAYTNIGKLSEYIDTIAKYYLIDKSYLSHDISVIIHQKWKTIWLFIYGPMLKNQ